MHPMNALMAEIERHISFRALSDRTGISRQTLSGYRNDEEPRPSPSSRRVLELACGLEKGTIDELLAGTVDLDDVSVSVAGPGQIPEPEWRRWVEWKLDRLESSIAALEHEHGV